MKEIPPLDPRIAPRPEVKRKLVRELATLLREEFDVDWGELKTETLLDAVLSRAGAMLYNRGVHDTMATLQEKVMDVEAERMIEESNG